MQRLKQWMLRLAPTSRITLSDAIDVALWTLCLTAIFWALINLFVAMWH